MATNHSTAFEFAIAGLLLIAVSGCGQQQITGSLSGKVTAINPKTKKPDTIQYGRITFFNSAGKQVAVTTIRDSAYHVENVPVGEVRISIVGFDLTSQEPRRNLELTSSNSKNRATFDQSKFFPLNPQYSSARTSPLTYRVVEGQQTFDAVLEIAGKR